MDWRKFVKFTSVLFVVVYIILFGVAFILQYYASSEWVKVYCKEYIYGPRNIIALIVDRICPGLMEVHSELCTQEESSMPEYAESIRYVIDRYKKQEAIDSKLREEYEVGGYSLQNPFIVLNPYGVSPLTALLMFETADDTKITLKVCGHKKTEDVVFNENKYSKKHMIPIYGLYAGENNTIEVIAVDKLGGVIKNEVNIQTEPLYGNMLDINLQIFCNSEFAGNVSKGLNFSHSSIDGRGIKYAFDCNGNIRWYLADENLPLGTNYNNGKNIYRSWGAASKYDDSLITQESYIGRIEKIFFVPGGIHHDVYVSNDKILVTSNHINSNQDSVLCLDITNGNIEFEIDYRKLLPRARYVGVFHSEKPNDWVHINSIVSYDGDFISSSNLQSAVLRHDKKGKIKWILSDPQDYPMYWKQYILRPIGAGFEYPYNQHAVEILPDYDNNPDTVDILLFDNGTSRNNMNSMMRKSSIQPELYSRLVHYRVNEKNMTVEQVWEYGKDRTELFSETQGDADLLPNGNILGTFSQQRGIVNSDNRKYHCWNNIYCEVDRSGNVIWECYATSNAVSDKYLDYRLCRTNIYNSSVDYSHLLDESHNYVPDEIMKKYGY